MYTNMNVIYIDEEFSYSSCSDSSAEGKVDSENTAKIDGYTKN